MIRSPQSFQWCFIRKITPGQRRAVAIQEEMFARLWIEDVQEESEDSGCTELGKWDGLLVEKKGRFSSEVNVRCGRGGELSAGRDVHRCFPAVR